MQNKKQRIMANYDWRCAYCGSGLPEHDAALDHIIPKSKGGTNSEANLIPACRSCNSSKKDMSLEDFRLFMAYKKTGDSNRFSVKQLRWLQHNTDFALAVGLKPYIFLFEV